MVVSGRSSAVPLDPADRAEGASRSGAQESDRSDLWWYAGGVVVGAALLLATALRQPFSYDELSQINPYGSDSIATIIGGTRQPPLDALLGGLFRHLLGQGQLQQRLVPLLSGIGILVVTSLLLRRLGLGRAGAWAVWVLATAPLAVRYGAYTRPYALPLFEMLLFAYATHRWLDGRQRRWLVTLVVTALALPFTRVPEPCVFLGVTAVMLAWASWRGRLRWDDTRWVVATSLGALFLVGVPMFLVLGSETQGSFFDPSPGGILGRAGRGLHEIATAVVPLLGTSFPWWPLSLAVLVVAVGVGASRRQLFSWPFWWSLLAAPVAFVLAYHLLNPFSFYALPYRSRAAYFFLPAYVLVTASVAWLVSRRRGLALPWRVALSALLGAALLAQLPATVKVVRDDAAPDFGRVSELIRDTVPDDAIVLYDRPAPAGQSRQPFQGTPRYLGSTPYTTTLAAVAKETDVLPQSGPVYVLVNGQCARPGRCHLSREPWTRDVPGWKLVATQERFSLYAPTDQQSGVRGVTEAMRSFGTALGPELGYVETLTLAVLQDRAGHHDQARATVRRLRAEVSPTINRRIDDFVELKNFPVPD
jgi:hypothetical protein